MHSRLSAALMVAYACVAAGCMFDVVRVTQHPAAFTPGMGAAEGFVLQENASISIGTGFRTRLRNGTKWRAVGAVAQGTVYATRDQVVTVEASNIHEAQLVVSGGAVTGFYLPIEKTFVPVSPAQPLKISPFPIQP